MRRSRKGPLGRLSAGFPRLGGVLTLYATYRDATDVSAPSARVEYTADDYESAYREAKENVPAGCKLLFVQVDR